MSQLNGHKSPDLVQARTVKLTELSPKLPTTTSGAGSCKARSSSSIRRKQIALALSISALYPIAKDISQRRVSYALKLIKLAFDKSPLGIRSEERRVGKECR